MRQALHLVFDASVIAQGMRDLKCRTGIYSVAVSLLDAFCKREDVLVSVCVERHNEEAILQYLKENYRNCRPPDCLTRDSEGRLCIPADVVAYFSPLTAAPREVIERLTIRRYSIVYDLIAIRHPEYAPVSGEDWWLPQLLRGFNADDFCFAISKATRDDFLRFRPDLDPHRVETLYLAADRDRFRPCSDSDRKLEVRREYGIPENKRFVFSLCTIEPRKNLLHTLKCFLRLVREDNLEDLVFVMGGTKWETFQAKFAQELSSYRELIAKYVLQIGYVADEDLPILYSDACFMPYMSLYEGFGLPPLEAMQCGCPVIASNTTSLPEVVGDAGVLLDPTDEDGLVSAMRAYCGLTEEAHKAIVRKGLERAAGFSWETAVDQISKTMRREAWMERPRACVTKEERPLVSVISIVYNLFKADRARSFLQCVESVHCQTYGHVEHLIIDGGSTDGTVALLERYQRKGWFHYVSEPDKGIYDAMNKGVRKARGKYVAFLNSDDYWHDNRAIEASVDWLEKEGADFSYAQAVVLDGERPVYLAPLSLGTFFVRMPFCHQTMFTRRDVLLKIGGFRSDQFRSAGDFDLILRLCLSGAKGVYVPLNFTSYRLGGLSAAYQSGSEIEAQRALYDAFSALLPDFDLGSANRLYMGRMATKALLLAVLDRVSSRLRQLIEAVPKVSVADGESFVLDVPGDRLIYLNGNSLQGFARRVPRPHVPLPVRVRSTLWQWKRLERDVCKNRESGKRLLYIGHSYHSTTKSVGFLFDLFGTQYDIHQVAVDPARVDDLSALDALPVRDFDVCVIFQLMPSIREIKKHVTIRHGVYFPMFDYYRPVMPVSKARWSEYAEFRIINFCRAVHEEVLACGFDSRYVQYFPEPREEAPEGDVDSVFFWERINQVNVELVARLLTGSDIKRMHIHRVSDPGHVAHAIPRGDSEEAGFYKGISLSESSWYETRDGMLKDVARSAVYIAPRYYEGIGLSFLEAMATGRCVIAADCPTMNEYIENGRNGVLYPFDMDTATSNARSLGLTSGRIREIQRQALESVRSGYARWQKDRQRILQWLEEDVVVDADKLADSAERFHWYESTAKWNPDSDRARWQKDVRTRPPKGLKEVNSPDVTVVTVIPVGVDAEKTCRCLDSVQKETGISLEHLVIYPADDADTARLLDRFANDRHVIRLLPLKAMGEAPKLNIALALSRGAFVAFLPVGGFYHDCGGVNRAIERMQKKGYDCLFSSAAPSAPEPDWSRLFVEMEFPLASMLFRRSAVVEAGGFDAHYSRAFGYDLVLRLALALKSMGFLADAYATVPIEETCGDAYDAECGDVYSRLYGPIALTPFPSAVGLDIRRQRCMPKYLKDALFPYYAIAFADVRGDGDTTSAKLRKLMELKLALRKVRQSPGRVDRLRALMHAFAIHPLAFRRFMSAYRREHRRLDSVSAARCALWQAFSKTVRPIFGQLRRSDGRALCVKPSSFWELEGAYAPEPWGTWGEKTMAITFPLRQGMIGRPLCARLSVGAFVCELHPNNSVLISVNGKKMAEIAIDSTGFRSVELEIPAAETMNPLLCMELSAAAVHSPSECGLGNDVRMLGVSFGGLSLACASSRSHDASRPKP